MRILISLFIVLFLTSCETTPNKELSVSQLPKETIEKPDKANIYFVRPMKLTNFLYETGVFISDNYIGNLPNNSTGKAFIDEGINTIVITTESQTDKFTPSLIKKRPFTTRFEKGKNYYFEIKPLPFYRFKAQPISRMKYVKLIKNVKDKEVFNNNLKSVGKVMGQVIIEASEAKKQRDERKKIEELNKKTEEMNKEIDKEIKKRQGVLCTLDRALSSGSPTCYYKCEDGSSAVRNAQIGPVIQRYPDGRVLRSTSCESRIRKRSLY